jgi:type I restriction enzyme M protein
MVCERFAQIDLHPETVSNAEMGLVFEELIRKFAELSNETAGEHFTPREVIRLMVNLIFIEDGEALTRPGVVRTLYDPPAARAACSVWGRSTCWPSTRWPGW